jgi:hypothetical protein
LNSYQQGIISDLFPGIVLPKPDYEVFLEALNVNIRKMKLQPVPWFIGKIIQVSSLYPYGNVPILPSAGVRNEKDLGQTENGLELKDLLTISCDFNFCF